MKYFLFLLLCCTASLGWTQEVSSSLKRNTLAVRDTLVIDSVGINPTAFAITDTQGNRIDSLGYAVDFKKGKIYISERTKAVYDSLVVTYLPYPEYLRKRYFELDRNIIVENTGALDKLYSLQTDNTQTNFTPFDGLNSVGSITRGVTIGNNQNAVVNSQLDLQITGKLNDKVSIRASIQDANIPTQEGGYSQSLDEFDEIFIELFSERWNIRAGDVDLQNNDSYFGKFTKKVQGISLGGTVVHDNGSQTSAFASGALVRGIFQRSQFVGEEGNQGPYKLVGPNGELFILIVSGSERVYVNGLLLNRGENEDYVIDYNAGEIRFNPTYPITANMRITVEYQYTDRSYTRFIGYGGGNHSSEKLDLGVYVYTENDAKNQPLQQNLSEEQVDILQQAGDDMDLMTAPSAIPDTFSENKILYRKELINGEEVFVFSTNPDDELFSVRFSLVGPNQGDYVLSNESTISRVFEYIPTVNGVPQGNYAPIIRLQAPVKLQIGGVRGNYHPSPKTNIGFELAGSQNDLNLFSDIDDGNNDGFAGRVAGNQRLFTTSDSLRVNATGSIDYIARDFRTVERLYNIEFTRDWNLVNPTGDQTFVKAGLEALQLKNGAAQYELQHLRFSDNFQGTRHVVNGRWKFGKLDVIANGSHLNSTGDSLDSKFTRAHTVLRYQFNKAWVGGKVSGENNQVRVVRNDSLTPVSQRFQQYQVFTGVGDSTKVFAEVGYVYRINDSVQNNRLQEVNRSNNVYLKSRLINNSNTRLSLFANYRELQYARDSLTDEKTLNTRLLYNQQLFQGGIRLNTTLESSNGVLPQQEFTYVKTEPGQGVFAWQDYNGNGVQELNEFEVAQFQDQAEYVRVLLPNQIFVKIRNNSFSQTLTLNPQSWASEGGFREVLSHFYNQTSYIVDRKIRRRGDNFNINPFDEGDEAPLGLSLNFRNALFFNRGKQRFTTSYTYLSSSSSNLLSLGLQTQKLKSHQLNINHKFWEQWLLNLKGALSTNESISENFTNRNYELDTKDVFPKLSFLASQQTRFDVFYQWVQKENLLGLEEELLQQNIGVSFAYNNVEKISINGEFKYIDNDFSGSAFSPVAYQMLEGLQPGTNYTWNVLFQKRITKYLDANISYFGRKSENTKTIHTGSVQLRAFF
ncbi:hypothetical protein [Altibacter sp. HG106]|uniref:hypothetical protein n=1 Tax=Altibacter sp. HG106 TaxID=3023937 RepID=UPI00234FC702|nr:hypothetical protein [Altibacter sp. HG106]MDC7995177.1 hypothetical protein [Altibacter sp. HG106]